ncbi:recombinase family protein, partial [Klebsiella pneumoniae]
VIYKLDRLTRSLSDFTRLIDLFDQHEVTFVSVTQSFDTQDSLGRLVLNILLTFAQFEREMLSDRICDKAHALR